MFSCRQVIFFIVFSIREPAAAAAKVCAAARGKGSQNAYIAAATAILLLLWVSEVTCLILVLYLRAAAPAADPGRSGKEAKLAARPFCYVHRCEIYLIGLNFHV